MSGLGSLGRGSLGRAARCAALVLGAALLCACGEPAASPSLTALDHVSASPSAEAAKLRAPQAHARATALDGEARALAKDGKLDESNVVAEQARVAYEEAFALVRVAEAKERLERAQVERDRARARLADLEGRQKRALVDAELLELQVRVSLDKEPVKDVGKLTPERARVRRQAAVALSEEALQLCTAANLLDGSSPGLAEAQANAKILGSELSSGAGGDDVLPRAGQARNGCLRALFATRRKNVEAAPEDPGSDALLLELGETGKLFAFRDDRGVVVNLPSPTGSDGKLTVAAKDALAIVGRASKARADTPLLIVVHSATAQSGKASLGKPSPSKAGSNPPSLGELVVQELSNYDGKRTTLHDAEGRLPVVDSRVAGAAERNLRVEVVFVTPLR